MLNIKCKDNLLGEFVKIYLSIFFAIIIFISFDLSYIKNYKKIIGANYNHTEEGIQIEKYLKIGDLHYNIIYEEVSEKYLVFINYNVFIGYINLENEEEISIVDENNFYKYLTIDSLRKK